MNVRDIVIGRVYGDYVGYRNSAELVVSVRVEEVPGVHETTDHRVVANVKRLSISAGVWNRQRTDFIACGQIRDALRQMKSYAPGWDADQVKTLSRIWSAWHLNDLTPGCAHQDDDREVCPESGYAWGNAWLVRELPESVIADVAALFSCANSCI